MHLLNIKSVSYLLHKKYAAAVTDGDLVERLEEKSKIMMLIEKKILLKSGEGGTP